MRGNGGPRYKHHQAESIPYQTLTLRKLTPIIGAEVDGIDLSRPLSSSQQQDVQRALAENCVIFFRDQQITPQQQMAFHGFDTLPDAGSAGGR